MGVGFPDPETSRAVLGLATRAPSVHNSQPWRWRVGSDALDLFADPGRHPGHTDPDRRDLLISCGAVLHHCTVALAAMGWRTKVHRLPDHVDPRHLAHIETVPQPAGELDVALAAAIPRRRTDRRRYGSWPVPWADIALMGARAARAGVMLRQIDRIPPLQEALAAPCGDDSSVVVALGTEGDDALDRLRAGEVTSLVLLSATAMGLSSCSVTEPLEAEHTRDAVRADVFGGSAHPQMMVRMGWAAVAAEPLPATPRRPLADVTEWLHDGACAASG